MLIGSKKSTVFVVDGRTGEVFKCYGYVVFISRLLPSLVIALSESDQSHSIEECELPDDPLVFGRIDFTVSAVDSLTHTERWNLTLSRFVVRSQCPDLGADVAHRAALTTLPFASRITRTSIQATSRYSHPLMALSLSSTLIPVSQCGKRNLVRGFLIPRCCLTSSVSYRPLS